MTASTITTFAELFSGSRSAFGKYTLDASAGAGKQGGKAATDKRRVTVGDFQRHLEGVQGIGIIPITEENTVSFCALDCDVYDLELHKAVVKAVRDHGLPLVGCRSKSGGLHLFAFFSAPEPANDAINFLNKAKLILGLPEDTEVFPKQAAVTPGAYGNWINLPYYNGDQTRRHAYGDDLTPMPLDDFVDYAVKCRTSVKAAQRVLSDLPLGDAPPCLQTIYLRGVTGQRNNYLFSLARYFKAKYGDGFDSHVQAANAALSEPIPPTELVNTIIKSHARKEYLYRCSDEPICRLCRKDICKERKFGIRGSGMSNVSFEEMWKYNTDPPYYVWRVNGKPLTFYSESELIEQKSFREQCLRSIGVLPVKLKDADWSAIITQAFANVVTKDPSSNELSVGSMFREYLTEFLTGRAMAKTIDQILMNKVFYDKDNEAYLFRGKDLANFLINQRQFKNYTLPQLQVKLGELEATSFAVFVNEANPQVRVWSIPKSAIAPYIENKSTVSNVDFMEKFADF